MRCAAPALASMRLRDFQDRFARALRNIDDDALSPIVAQPGFAVYRNTVLKGCIDALAANFPSVLRLVGSVWFRDAAAIYARAHLPRHPVLLDYGAGFVTFLAGFAPAAELPYLAAVAHLDRFWSEAHGARDESPLAAGRLAALSPARLARTVLRPHASARWAWFDTMPIRTIWQRNRHPEVAPTADIVWQPEGVLIFRPHGAVRSLALDVAGCAFLDACAAGRPLIDATQAAADASSSADLAQLTSTLFSCGVFAQTTLRDHATDEENE